jgi:pyruvate/2-oxoglutarate dehydrogenase complex dihydrolipoamide dehydrogenase (E3) component
MMYVLYIHVVYVFVTIERTFAGHNSRKCDHVTDKSRQLSHLSTYFSTVLGVGCSPYRLRNPPRLSLMKRRNDQHQHHQHNSYNIATEGSLRTHPRRCPANYRRALSLQAAAAAVAGPSFWRRSMVLFVRFCCVFVLLHGTYAAALATDTNPRKHSNGKRLPASYDDVFDIVIIGAGASGLFAAGAALSFGWKTLLLDQGKGYVGGDCSNAACVPSKALRSIASMPNNMGIMEALDHTIDTVMAVRNREDIASFENVTNLELVLVESSRFVSKSEMEIVPRAGSSEQDKVPRRIIRGKKFLIATGAAPIVPGVLKQEASLAGLPLFTYRTVLSPSENAAWREFCADASSMSSPTPKHIVIVGGGPSAFELGQSLSRLNFSVTLVAPNTLLQDEDVSLQQSACQILRHDGVQLCFGRRVVGVNATNKHVTLDDGSQLPADALLVCVGRKPSINDLNLDAADIAWNLDSGVQVKSSSLQSRSNPHVFACGDCCSAVRGKDRKAAHAGWTGYHAIRNMGLPWILWAGSRSVHPAVPSVTFTNPELASVGMTRYQCLEKFGQDDFVYLSIREQGMDRADMERKARFVEPCFVELRAEKRTGRILGLSACGPTAAELANEIGLAIQNKLTVQDLAKSIHSYPSHGYMLYRVALSMALSSVQGFLAILGPIGQAGGKLYGGVSRILSLLHPSRALPWKSAKRQKQHKWEAVGQQWTLIVPAADQPMVAADMTVARDLQCLPISFLEYFQSEHYKNISRKDAVPAAFADWLRSKPS